MTQTIRLLGLAAIPLVALAGALGLACSSSSSSSGDGGAPPQDSGGPADTGADVFLDPLNCVPPTMANNSAGVGGYCTPGGNQCEHAGPDGSATLCTADVGMQVPPHAWFCTSLCSLDAGTAKCGNPGPPCVLAEGEPVCLPTTCASFLGDAGSD